MSVLLRFVYEGRIGMRYSIDRIEGEYAVCEGLEHGEKQKILLSSLPPRAREGDVIRLENGCYFRDGEETEKRSSAAEERMKRLFARESGRQ